MGGARRWMMAAWMLAAMLALATSCHGSNDALSGKALGEFCYVNTDCSDQLVCAFQHCHKQCLSDKDCTPPSYCVGAQLPKAGVCTIPGTDTPPDGKCGRNSDCLPPLVCGRNFQCEEQCKNDRDCIESQTCFEGACFDRDTAPDATTPGEAGQTCTLTSDCTVPLVCRFQICTVDCNEDRDCTLAGQHCVGHVCAFPGGPDAGGDGKSDGTIGDAIPPDAPPGYGAPCDYSSDCKSAMLVCRAGKCLYECLSDADCPITAGCVHNVCIGGARGSDGGVDAGPDAIDSTVDTPPTDAKTCHDDFECDDGVYCNGAELCIEGKCVSRMLGPLGPCDTHRACYTDTCSESSPHCTSTPISPCACDVDADGYLAIDAACPGGNDCNDHDKRIYPGAPERCGTIDYDCNGQAGNGALAPRIPASVIAGTATGLTSITTVAVTVGTTPKVALIASDAKQQNVYGYLVDPSGTVGPEKTLYAGSSTRTAILGGVGVDDTGTQIAMFLTSDGGKPHVQFAASDLTPGTSTDLTARAGPFQGGVAFDGTNWFVAWNEGTQAYTEFLRRDGVVTGAEHFLPTDATGRVLTGTIFVGAPSGARVVVYEGASGLYQALTVSATAGTKVDGPVTLGASSTPFTASSVAGATELLGYNSYLIEQLVPVTSAGVLGTPTTTPLPIALSAYQSAAFDHDATSFGLGWMFGSVGVRFIFYPHGLTDFYDTNILWDTSLPGVGDRITVRALGGQWFVFDYQDSVDKQVHLQVFSCPP